MTGVCSAGTENSELECTHETDLASQNNAVVVAAYEALNITDGEQ